MKIIFFGTPEFCLPVVQKLQKTFTKKVGDPAVVGIVTQEPKKIGRKQILTYSPVDKWAHTHKIPTFYSPQSLLDKGVTADLGILAAYGNIISQDCLDYFPFGILNIHPSLLPALRGASPLQEAIAQGIKKTGATIIKLDSKMDHGPIVASFTEDILDSDTPQSLGQRIFEKSAQVIVDLIPAYVSDKIQLREQDHSKATFTKLLSKDSGFITSEKITSALGGLGVLEFDRLYRAMQPWPGMWTLLRQGSGGQARRLKILKIHLENEKLIIDEVQVESRNPVSWKQFTAAHGPF